MSKRFLALALALSSFLAVFAFHTEYSLAEAPASLRYRFSSTDAESSPIQLTAADGSGLKLKLYQARTVIQGPLAFTELRLTFENPEPREREGRFRITLPDRAAISRFAMRIDDKWQEAEVVERQAARRAYEDFLHRRQDPALLEKAAGNEFRARIFPIPANGQKELILSYSQELQSDSDFYTLPVAGLPTVADFEVEVQLEQSGKQQKLILKEKNFTPPGNFQLDGLNTDSCVAGGALLVARVSPELNSRPETPEDLLVLLDTSASRALGLESQKRLLEELVKQLPTVQRLTVTAFDQEVEEIYSGSPGRLDWRRLEERGALGATDLAKALSWAAKRKGHSRLLLITDGVSTAGDAQLRELLKGSGIERVDAIVTGGIRDKAKMELLVDSGATREGVVLDGETPIGTMARALSSSVASGLDVSVENALWAWPSTLDNVQPGDQRLVYAQLPNSVEGPVRISVGGQDLTLAPRRFEASPLLDRSAAVARIARWEAELSETDDPEKKVELSEQIVSLSRAKRVLSDKTALLVLETEEDYQRFNIDRNALSDILTVGKSGLVLSARKELVTARVATKQQAGELKKDAEKAVDKSALEDNESDQPADGAPPPIPEPEPMADAAPPVEAPVAQVRQESPRPSVPAARPAPRRRRVSTGSASDVTAATERDEDEVAAPEEAKEERTPPLTGEFAEIDQLLRKGKRSEALKKARLWQKREPGNVLALIALGNCLEAMNRKSEAARVFGSIIDLFPSRADLRRYAGSRLQALGPNALELAVDSFEKAVEQRPDHVSSHRYLAFALARRGDFPAAVEALEAGLSRRYPSGRFAGYERILKEDLGLLAAAWKKQEPSKKNEIYTRLKKYDAKLAKEPSLRFVLTWETDANDVDFHIRDSKGGHAYYSDTALKSGGELFSDVTTGYGPECFAIDGKPTAYPYDLEIHYYSRGPMGYGMGQLEILEHDGKGGLTFEERPYVVMEDGAYVDLGRVEK